jgi:two-component sensor histidine kinase/PAS domain-containing protein
MHDGAGSGDDHFLQSLDEELVRACRTHTDLGEADIQILLEVNHSLRIVHDLEGGDIFIDCLTPTGEQAVVIAQLCPPDTNYPRNIVGELMLPSNEPGVFRTLQIGVPSRKLKAVVTGDYLIRQNVSAIRNPEGRVIGVLIVERHIQGADLWDPESPSEILKAAYDAKEMEHVAEYMNDGLVRFNMQSVAVYANTRARQIYGGINYMDDIVGMPFENLAFGEIRFDDICKTGRNAHTEVKIGGFILNVVYAPIFGSGNEPMGAVMLIEDRTEEKNIEKELVLKSAVIDEIHHRVKNNLQTIISLLRLQRRRISSADARTAFSETMARIFSISLSHEILAQTGVDDVDIKDMLSRMLNHAKSYIIPENLDLTLEVHGDSIQMASSMATSIAMVVNELVQNCIKHAFIDRQRGCILLVISRGMPYSSIEITDDGVGYRLDDVREGSLGHKLVQSLVQDKLFGKLMINSSPEGTKAVFTFLTEPTIQRAKDRENAVQRMLEDELAER